MSTSSKNALIISHEFPPLGGGAGIACLNLCNQLIDLGYEVTLVTRSNKFHEVNGLDDRIRIVAVPYVRKAWILFYLVYLLQLRISDYDKIIINDLGAMYVCSLLPNRFIKKSIYILHGSEPESVYLSNSFANKFKMFFFHRVLVNSCKVVCVSQYMAEKIHTYRNFLKVKADVSLVVNYIGLPKNNGDNTSISTNKVRNAEEQIDTIRILTVCRLDRKKGLDTLLSFFDNSDFNQDFLWTVVGGGPYLDEFRKKVKCSNVSSKVNVVGFVPFSELGHYYKQSDVFILLSDYAEALGLVYIEAQSHGVPAIGWNRYGVKEAISNGRSGYLIDSLEELSQIFSEQRFSKIQTDDVLSFSSKFCYSSCLINFKLVLENDS